MQPDRTTGTIVDAALAVHRALGPGLLESAYEHCLAHELRTRGLQVRTQIPVPIRYEDVRIDAGYRIDMLVDERVIVEVKAVERLQAIHEAQLLSHLKMSGHRVGLLLNFHVRYLNDGIKRKVNRWDPQAPSPD